VAAMLGIDPKTLYTKMKKSGFINRKSGDIA